MSNSKKTYIDGIFVREKEFDWGTVMSVSINVPKFIEELGKYQTKKDFAHFNINKRKQAHEKGMTHYVTLDDWRVNKEGLKNSSSDDIDNGIVDDDIPF